MHGAAATVARWAKIRRRRASNRLPSMAQRVGPREWQSPSTSALDFSVPPHLPHALLGVFPDALSWPVEVILATSPDTVLKPRLPEHNDSRTADLELAVSNQVAAVARNNATHPIRILVVEDEVAVGAILCEAFQAEGFVVSEARDKAALFRSLETESVNLITLDLALGRDDGLELARQVRALRNVPIVMITGRGAPFDRVVGLEHGADDYISKPFHIREVVLRIHSVLRATTSKRSYPSRAPSSSTRSSLAFWTPLSARCGKSMVHCSILPKASSCSSRYSSRIRRGSSLATRYCRC
jgi:CheY-like chemotaxis protein